MNLLVGLTTISHNGVAAASAVMIQHRRADTFLDWRQQPGLTFSLIEWTAIKLENIGCCLYLEKKDVPRQVYLTHARHATPEYLPGIQIYGGNGKVISYVETYTWS